jgi:hypothetical protein
MLQEHHIWAVLVIHEANTIINKVVNIVSETDKNKALVIVGACGWCVILNPSQHHSPKQITSSLPR